ncbi:MAG: rRNA maturation RNase YbeY [Clostridia bacterium]
MWKKRDCLRMLAEISLTFVDMEEIQQLNREYRDTDSVTDVLSFPQFESKDEFPKVVEKSYSEMS